MKNFFIPILLIIAVAGFSLFWFEIPQKQTPSIIPLSLQQEALKYAQENLPKEGRLIVKPDGFTYLKVDDNYIYKLFPMLGLKEDGFREPPYFRTRSSPGAHISVFYKEEHIKPEEAGQYFQFKLKDIVIVRPSKYISFAILKVESPELEKLREKYGKSPKLLGHEFHITLAKKTVRRPID